MKGKDSASCRPLVGSAEVLARSAEGAVVAEGWGRLESGSQPVRSLFSTSRGSSDVTGPVRGEDTIAHFAPLSLSSVFNQLLLLIYYSVAKINLVTTTELVSSSLVS